MDIYREKPVIFIFLLGLFFSFYLFSPEYLSGQQVVNVTATVATSITCTVSTSTTAFGTIDTSNVFTSIPNVTTTISCNPASGCTLSVRDQGDGTNGGLYKSTSPTYLIPSPAAGFPATANLSAGTEGYGIQAATTTAGSGSTLSLNSRYNHSFSGNTVGGLTTTTIPLASSSAPTANREVVVSHKAAVSGLTPAGSYSDTITYSCISN
mgnify:FL=1